VTIALPPLDAPPATVRRRLLTTQMQVGSTHFPTPAELRAWLEHPAPFWVRQLGNDRYELGPHAGSMAAAVFYPVLELTIEAASAGSRVRARVVWNRFTRLWLLLFAVIASFWAVTAWRAVAGGAHFSALLWWLAGVSFVVAGVGLGWRRGRALIEERVGALIVALSHDAASDDW
jgi:hypothetical protein